MGELSWVYALGSGIGMAMIGIGQGWRLWETLAYLLCLDCLVIGIRLIWTI